MGSDYIIRTGNKGDEPVVGALMALAFASDPFVRWILPDPNVYVQGSMKHAANTAPESFVDGHVHIIGRNYGAIVWVPPGNEIHRNDPENGDGSDAGGRTTAELGELIKQSEVYYPDEPYWYLAWVAVDPMWRGKGLGTALLKHTLDICDQSHQPAYLESTNAANLSIYERHGFELLAEVQVGNSPKRYPMLRPAR